MKTLLLVIACFTTTCYGWDTEQLEVFDVVEEVKENFYELLKINNNATSPEIRSAFRRLSVVLHPDKNPNEDTSEKFRNLVSVYEVLKDEKKRGYYDDVLINGLPNWKSAMYYYRRVRKMGLLEGFLIVFLLITIGQYLVAWASYFEQKFTLEQQAKPKKQKKNAPPPVTIMDIPKPSVLNTLPIQIPYLLYYITISTPSAAIFLAKQLIPEKKPVESEDEEEVVYEPKVRRKRPGFAIPEGPTFETQETTQAQTQQESSIPVVSGGLWTDDDIDELIQLVKKYPGGTSKRWEVIAECIGRSVAEVTFMNNKLKTNGYRMHAQEEEVIEEKVKHKTKGGKLAGSIEESAWSQIQQKALEDALAKFAKGATGRWDRISELVPGKSKEECMLRYKHVVEMIQKRKDQ